MGLNDSYSPLNDTRLRNNPGGSERKRKNKSLHSITRKERKTEGVSTTVDVRLRRKRHETVVEHQVDFFQIFTRRR